MTNCDRQHVSVGIAIFDIIDGVEHCLFGYKLKNNPLGYPGWELSGGKVDPGEYVDAGAVREVLEETGLIVSVDFSGQYVETGAYVCLVFIGIPIGGELKLCEPDKHREWAWFRCDHPVPRPLLSHATDALIAINEVRHGQFRF